MPKGRYKKSSPKKARKTKKSIKKKGGNKIKDRPEVRC